MDANKKRWGVEQWAAYFETRNLPVMPRSKQQLLLLEEERGDRLSARELVPLLLSDPLLCLRVLREAERVRTHRLGKETTTPLAAVMQLGIEHCKELLLSSDEVDMSDAGLLLLERRSSLAAQISLKWATRRNDLNPSEVALAALLSDTGELLLWLYEPELAQAALDELHSGRAKRSSQAQIQACGFDFKQLTIRCCEMWNLPALLSQLLRGADTERAQLTRVCSNLARHLATVDHSCPFFQALISDLVDVHRLMTFASLEWLVGGLPDLSEEEKQQIIDLAHEKDHEEWVSENFMATNPNFNIKAPLTVGR